METQNNNKIIWRDDDIAYKHEYHEGKTIEQEEIFYRFCKIDKLFKKYNVIHTIAVIANEIEKAKVLVEYIKKNKHIDVQLHGWEHLHYPLHLDVFEEHLLLGIKKIEKVFGKRPTIFFVPYNEVCLKMVTICNQHNIECCFEKMSITNYLNGYKRKYLNFHYWADECIDLEKALIKYTDK